MPATVAYSAATNTATLTPQNALAYGATYTAKVKGGAGGVTDLAGNALAADLTWSFSTEASPPPILVVGSTANQFGTYLGEILRNEGLLAFTTIDVAFLSPALLAAVRRRPPGRDAVERRAGDRADRLGHRRAAT